MKLAILAALLTLVAAQTTFNPNEPAPYPEGVYCTPQGDLFHGLQTSDHPCSCAMMMRQNEDGCCTILQNNDPKCKQYCTESHCRCPRECVKS
jgi:hypothetical protein